MLCTCGWLLQVWTNFLGLMRTVPDGISVMNVWLLHFLIVSFYFNIACFVEQVLVNFAIQVRAPRRRQNDDGSVAEGSVAEGTVAEGTVAKGTVPHTELIACTELPTFALWHLLRRWILTCAHLVLITSSPYAHHVSSPLFSTCAPPPEPPPLALPWPQPLRAFLARLLQCTVWVAEYEREHGIGGEGLVPSREPTYSTYSTNVAVDTATADDILIEEDEEEQGGSSQATTDTQEGSERPTEVMDTSTATVLSVRSPKSSKKNNNSVRRDPSRNLSRSPSRRMIKAAKVILDEDGDGNVGCKEVLRCWILLKKRVKYPLLKFWSHFRYSDHYMRVLLPLIYVPWIIAMLAEVSFGRGYDEQLALNDHCVRPE